MQELECSIGEIFDAIQQLENIEFQHDVEQFQKSQILIPDEKSDWINIKGLITKQDSTRELKFSDSTVLKVANKHKMFDGRQEIMVDTITEGHEFTKADGTLVTVVSNTLHDLVETVYDMEVDSATHLYQTADGLIHHNTELARQLSEQLGNLKLLRYDMSEFMEETGVAKLTGSAQGYVGYEEGGRLINDIKKHPHCILLLDEFEKAHHKIQNTFLQILEEAELSSSDGTKADFRNVFIIFTTNAGSKISKTVGFGGDAGKSKANAQIEKAFSPEFRNRLDGIITFNPLGEEQILKVTDKILNEVRDQLKTKEVQLTVTKAAKDVMAEKGFDKEMGARPMKRVIQDLVKKPVAKEIVIGCLKDGGRVKVDANKDGEITLKYTSKVELDEKKAATKAKKEEESAENAEGNV